MYSVKANRFLNGEEYPLLVFSESGVPVWYPTLFATSQVRNKSHSSSHINSYLQAIRLLLEWAESLPTPTNLKLRFTHKEWLLQSEIESLYDYISKRRNEDSASSNSTVISIKRNSEKAVFASARKSKSVQNSTIYKRIGFICDYLSWFAIRVIEERENHLSTADRNDIKSMCNRLMSMRSTSKNRNQANQRKGLDEEQREELLSLIDPENENNPFTDYGLKVRNLLIVWFGYYIGLRDGEILNLRISDFNFAAETFLVARRADSPADARTKQPKVKTRDRRLKLSGTFASKITGYITDYRSKVPGARKHDYLFVTHKPGPTEGHPIAQTSVEKALRKIRGASSKLPDNLTMHMLRHTSNDRFSEMADAKHLSEEKEKKLRNYQMGWSETSNTAATYTKRHTERAAHEASLEMQEKLERGNKQ